MIKIALTNLRSYNEGDLIFEWVELPCDDFDEVLDRIGRPEEYFISDYECEIPHMTIHEYENLDELNELAENLNRLFPYELKAIQAIMEIDGSDVEEAIDTVKDGRCFFYETDSFEEFIDLVIDDGFFGEITDEVKEFLDYEKLTNYFKNIGYTLSSVGVINTDF
jgi:antirestriction protein